MRFVALALVLVGFCIGVLAGCGSSSGTNNGCCATCKPPPGVCPGDPAPAGYLVFDAGDAEASEQ